MFSRAHATVLPWITLTGTALIAAAAPSAGQSAAAPPTHSLGRIVATASDSFGSVSGLVQLSDGRVMVLDEGRRRVLLLDSTLRRSTAIMDTSGTARRRFTAGTNGPYRQRADSILFSDYSAHAMILVAPDGAIARVFAPPPGVDGGTGDGLGNLVYEGNYNFTLSAADSAIAVAGHALPDSVALLRANLLSRRVDTVAYLRTTRYLGKTLADSCGRSLYQPLRNPLKGRDAWTVLTDGTIAVVRYGDLHVDWIGADGPLGKSPKLPHQWVRLTDSIKDAYTDSLHRRDLAQLAGPLAKERDACERQAMVARLALYTLGEDLSDYAPPFPILDPVLADADDNLWIRTSTERIDDDPAGKARIYLVVNQKGQTIDQVTIPGGTSIVGFGPGVAYQTSRTGKYVQLVRVRIR